MPTEREIFERFFPGKTDPSRLTREIIAFGVYQFRKWDRIREQEKQNGDSQSFETKYFEIADGFPENEVDDFERVADETLRTLTPERRGFEYYFYGVSQSIVGSLLFLILLTLLYLGLKVGFGLDLVTAIGINIEVVEEARESFHKGTLPAPVGDAP